MPMVPPGAAPSGSTPSPLLEAKPSGSSLMMAAATMADLGKGAKLKEKSVAKKA